jgi:hypothetical protein
MTSPLRIAALVQSIEYIVTHNIPGAIVECGVWRGGSMMAAALTLNRLRRADRPLWLYDTFAGMTEPTPEDVDFLGRPAGHLLRQHGPGDAQSIRCVSPLDEVRGNLIRTGYPASLVRFVRGPVEQTLRDHKPGHIALLRLDTDWYESTRAELVHLMPRLSSGGVLIIDDYGHWQGCRRAVDEFFDRHRVPMLLMPIDYTGRIGVLAAPTARPTTATEAVPPALTRGAVA